MKLRVLALSAVMLLSLAACTGATAVSPSVASAPVPPVSPTAPPPSALPSASMTSQPAASEIPHGAPDLEALLPATFRGKQLVLTSKGPAEIAGTYLLREFIPQLVQRAGGDSTKAEVAAAYDEDLATHRGDTPRTFSIHATYAPGADSARLVEVYVGDILASVPSMSASKEMRGGKQVTRLTDKFTSVPDAILAVYAVDDVLYEVFAANEELADELIPLVPRTAS